MFKQENVSYTSKKKCQYYFFLIIMLIISIGFLIFISLNIINNKNLIQNKYFLMNKTYNAFNYSGVISNSKINNGEKIPCGPTYNYEIIYYVSHVDTNITTRICATDDPMFNCCSEQYEKCDYMTDTKVSGFTGFGTDCLPIIETGLEFYNIRKVNHLYDFWTNNQGNVFLSNKYFSNRIPNIIMFIVLIINIVIIFTLLIKLLLKDSYSGQSS